MRSGSITKPVMACLTGALMASFVVASGEAAFPGQNGRIAFVSNRDGNDEIYTMTSDGSGQTRRTNNPVSDSEPSLSPDGRTIAFRRGANADPASEVFSMQTGGSGQTQLTDSPLEDLQPSFSPDGAKLVFSTRREDPTPPHANAELYLMNADGTSQTALTVTAPPISNHAAVFSRDGTRIAFVSTRENADFEIWVMNADGTSPTRLTNSAGLDLRPSWSPDGTKIAFASARSPHAGNREIYTMNADGTSQTRRTTSAGTDEDPAWSPDGTKIAFASERDGDFEIFVMDPDGTNPTALTDNTAADIQPDWGPVVPPPANITPPSIPGNVTTGDSLTCDPGTWTESPSFEFEWLRDGSPIAGATAQTYQVTAADVDHQLSCRVTATSLAGLRGQATSNSVVPIAPAPPAATATPTPTASPKPTATPTPVATPAPTRQEQALAVAPAAQVFTAFGLPSPRKCLSRRRFSIRLKRPAGVTIATARLSLNGRAVRVRKSSGRFVATVDLRRLPKGTFTLAIRVRTVSGKTIKATRRYKTCARKRVRANGGPL